LISAHRDDVTKTGIVIYLLIYGFFNAAAKNSNYKKTNVKYEQPIMICKGCEESGSVVILTWMLKFS